jgi:uncharacterized membrane protein YphA (DoxX/SURF4 family)
MWHAIKVVLIGMAVFAIIANHITKAYSLENHKVCIGLIILGGLLYFLNIFLVRFFIKKTSARICSK